MKKLQFKTEINATAQVVYEVMLGLKNKSTYEKWTASFNPTSTYEGSWEKGSKMYFIGENSKGKKGGMVSRIEENQTAAFVSILHYGFLDGDTEITTGEQIEKWTGGYENFTFHESNGITLVTVDIDAVEDFMDFFNETYPLALEKLKQICE